jgi:hypothetical protein
MKKRVPRQLAGLVGIVLIGAVHAQSTTMEIFQLRFRTADQMIPLIRPLVPPPGTVTGLQNQLIVRTTPQNMAEIQAVIARIDTVPRRLLITVRQDADLITERERLQGSGTVPLGRSGEVVVGTPGRPGVTVDVISSQRSEVDRNTQQIQALEGQPAFIQIGQSTPVPTRQVVRGPWGTQVVDSVEYRDTSTGFQVLPRVNGDLVFLEILPQRETPGANMPGAVNTQRLATTVSGRLGEWIELGGASRTVDERQSVLLGRTTASGAEQRRVLVRVEELR